MPFWATHLEADLVALRDRRAVSARAAWKDVDRGRTDVALAREARLRAARQALDVIVLDAELHTHATLDELHVVDRSDQHAMQAHRHSLVDAGGVRRVEVDFGVAFEHALLVGDERDQAGEAEERGKQEHVHLPADAAEAPWRAKC